MCSIGGLLYFKTTAVERNQLATVGNFNYSMWWFNIAKRLVLCDICNNRLA